MPRRDGIEPNGMGTMIGRGMGFCNTGKALSTIGRLGLGLGIGLDLGCRRGLRRNGFNNTINSGNQKDLLNGQKAIL